MLRILNRESADAAGAGVDQDALAGASANLRKALQLVSPTSGSDAACRLARRSPA